MQSLRYRGAMLLGVLALLAATVAVADVFLVDFYGYDYWNPLTMPITTPGNCYNALGFVPAVNPTYLTFNYGLNEYTFSLQGICLGSVDVYGDYQVFTLSGGTLDIYGDALLGGTAADYGVNPPNATAPSTFSDGDNVLGGDVSGMQIVVNTVTGNADLSGMVNLNRGTQLGNIPVDQRAGWTLAGLRVNAPLLPEGYFWQIDGQLFIQDPTPTETGSWGSIKRAFAGGE